MRRIIRDVDELRTYFRYAAEQDFEAGRYRVLASIAALRSRLCDRLVVEPVGRQVGLWLEELSLVEEPAELVAEVRESLLDLAGQVVLVREVLLSMAEVEVRRAEASGTVLAIASDHLHLLRFVHPPFQLSYACSVEKETPADVRIT
ncbi:MAG: hypothetical protein D6806_09820, partial [Deltaproteobacteria bacterium]